jgi:hypothetical protein
MWGEGWILRTAVVIMYRTNSPPTTHEQEAVHWVNWSDWKMPQRAEFDLFHCKLGNQLTYHVKTDCFHFIKFDNRNNKTDINVKTSYFRNVGESDKKTIFTFSVPNNLPHNVLKYSTRGSNHPVQNSTYGALFIKLCRHVTKTDSDAIAVPFVWK